MAINLKQFSGGNKGGFGQGAYDRARAAGLSDDQIRSSLPSSGLKLGEAVNRRLNSGGGGGNAPMPQPQGRFSNFNFGAYGGGGFGAKDLEFLKSRGASYSDIGQVARQAVDKGLNISHEVRTYGANKPTPTRNLLKNFGGNWTSANLPGVNFTELANDADIQALTGKTLGAGKYYGNGKYQVVAGNARESGWGDYVPPGFEKVGYTTSSMFSPHPKYGSWSKKVGDDLLILRQMQEEGGMPWPDLPPNQPPAASPMVMEGMGGGGMMPEEEEELDKSISSGAGGAALDSKATGFRMARSSRQLAGRKAQGIGSQKKNPFTSWRV